MPELIPLFPHLFGPVTIMAKKNAQGVAPTLL